MTTLDAWGNIHQPGGRPDGGRFATQARAETVLSGPLAAQDDPWEDAFGSGTDLPPGRLLDALYDAGRAVLDDHGLTSWTLAYTTGQGATLGSTQHAGRVIALSAPNMVAISGAERLDTVLHEVAHALCDPDAGHGPRWKAKALEVGARPAMKADVADDHARASAVIGTCPMGHKEGRGRMPSAAVRARTYCNHRDHPRHQPYDERLMTYVRNALDPEVAAAAARHPEPKIVAEFTVGDPVRLDVPGYRYDGAAGVVWEIARTRCVVRLDNGVRVRAPIAAVVPL